MKRQTGWVGMQHRNVGSVMLTENRGAPRAPVLEGSVDQARALHHVPW